MGKAASRSSPDLADPSARTLRILGRDDNRNGKTRRERIRNRAAYLPPVFNTWRQAAERRHMHSLGREPQV